MDPKEPVLAREPWSEEHWAMLDFSPKNGRIANFDILGAFRLILVYSCRAQRKHLSDYI